MSRRIEIELTSARPDGTWTWRAAGAREPKGILASSILPGGTGRVGDVLRAEVETELDGTTVLNTAPIKGKAEKSGLLEILPSARPFEAVTQQLAKRERSDRGDRGDRGDRRDRPPRRPDGDRPPRADGDRRPPRRDGAPGARPTGEGDRRPPRRDGDAAAGDRRERRPRPNFTPPPELPQRPKPKRLKPGRVHRQAVLADLPEEQRAVAERALQGGIPAVRQAVQEQNARLKSEGKEEIPAAGLIQMAEQLLPRLRVAEWLDRATAAKADLADLALPDLRSVVASSEDPVVARDESTRVLAAELKQALTAKQESETLLWLDDITAALGVGRVIRALKLSSQPPKAGIRFPPELATQLAEAATASLTTDAMPDRWAAVLEAAAFAPVRALVKPTAPPTQSSDELTSTMKRLAPALPQIAALFGIEVTAGSSMPKPMRPTRPTAPARKAAPAPKAPAQKRADAPAVATETPIATETPVATEVEAVEPDIVEPVAVEPVAVESEAVESVAVEADIVETAIGDAEIVETDVAATEPVEAELIDTVEPDVAEVEHETADIVADTAADIVDAEVGGIADSDVDIAD